MVLAADDESEEEGAVLCKTLHKDVTAAEFDSVTEDVVRWTAPPGPYSSTVMVVSAEIMEGADDATMAVRPRERIDLMFDNKIYCQLATENR